MGCRYGEPGEIFFEFRQWGLHAPEEAAIQSEACSLGEAAMTLIADARIRELFFTRSYSDCDDVDSMSSGRVSPDLCDTWHHVLPMSPQWEGELELGSDDDYEDGSEYEDVGSSKEYDSTAESGL